MAEQCSRAEVVMLLQRTRGPDAAQAAAARLPYPKDLHRDARLINSLGLTLGELMEDLGASP